MRQTFALALVLLNGCIFVAAQNIGIENTAKYLGNGRYSWTVFVTGDTKALDQISGVQYTLHPSFPKPVVWGMGPKFSFSTVGWGEFNIVAKIFYKDKQQKPTMITHWLHLLPRNVPPKSLQQKRQ